MKQRSTQHEMTAMGIDLAKNTFHLHGVYKNGTTVVTAGC